MVRICFIFILSFINGILFCLYGHNIVDFSNSSLALWHADDKSVNQTSTYSFWTRSAIAQWKCAEVKFYVNVSVFLSVQVSVLS